jgi:uncharacterized protein
MLRHAHGPLAKAARLAGAAVWTPLSTAGMMSAMLLPAWKPMVLDGHTHIFPPEIQARRDAFFPGEADFQLLYGDPGSRLVGAESLIEYLDREEIDAACAFGFPWKDTELSRRCNDYVLDAAARYPGRVIPFACVQPLSGRPAIREAERCLAAGAAGLGEIATYGEGLGPTVRRSLAPLAELCREAEVPLLLHTNEPVGHAYPGKSPMEVSDVYELVRSHQETRWILAHWGGGLFFFHLLKREAEEVLRNAWFDTAAGPFLYKPKIYREFLAIVGDQRLVFGSDYPLLPLSRYRGDLAAAGVPEGQEASILGANLARLLKYGASPPGCEAPES